MHQLKRNLAHFLGLPMRDKGLIMMALMLVPFVRLAVSQVGLVRVMAWLGRRQPGPPTRAPITEVRTIARLVDWACAHSLGEANCLTRSLLLKWLLLGRGVECELRIGVHLDGKTLQAHAWITYQGEPINDQAEIGDKFAPFDSPVSPMMFTDARWQRR